MNARTALRLQGSGASTLTDATLLMKHFSRKRVKRPYRPPVTKRRRRLLSEHQVQEVVTSWKEPIRNETKIQVIIVRGQKSIELRHWATGNIVDEARGLSSRPSCHAASCLACVVLDKHAGAASLAFSRTCAVGPYLARMP